ncbi:hypothetical protein LTR28_006153 [Elasticomyces elasticus]|nr:hypothetical protein LTR28_006153 [Elasticomyces elasticus]
MAAAATVVACHQGHGHLDECAVRLYRGDLPFMFAFRNRQSPPAERTWGKAGGVCASDKAHVGQGRGHDSPLTIHHFRSCTESRPSEVTALQITMQEEKLDRMHVEDASLGEKAELREDVSIDPVAEKRLLRKLDLHVIPPLFFLFLLAFLDRTNIGEQAVQNCVCENRLFLTRTLLGNAKIQGMTEDLKMTGNHYNIALFIFFIPYILFEVPSNIIIKRVAPSTWLSIIMVLWGISTIGQGLVTNFGGLVACRFLVGIFEAVRFDDQTHGSR